MCSWTHRSGQGDGVQVQVSLAMRPGSHQSTSWIHLAVLRNHVEVPNCTGNWREERKAEGLNELTTAGLQLLTRNLWSREVSKLYSQLYLFVPQWTEASGLVHWMSTPQSYKDAQGSERSAGDVAPRCPTWLEGKLVCRWRVEWPGDKIKHDLFNTESKKWQDLCN